LLGAGVALAAATMFPRMVLEAAVVNARVLPLLAPVLGVMAALGFTAAALLWWSAERGGDTQGEVALRNPFEIAPALQFGALLAGIMLLAEAARAWMGDTGLYVLSGVSGLTDVDAITLSLSRLAHGDLSTEVAARAITLAAMVNTAVKGILVAAIAGRGMAVPVGVIFGVILAGGLAAAALV
ncbi:MAG TPA: DUF4010 domain-containing protein, partial [Gammaproteobacteria bacterium]|nr:DUF4010 domain-containing protein [Gammaproteobacteria bacterium]